MQDDTSDDTLIDRAGGTAEVARLFEISPQAVSQWRRTGMPKVRRQLLAFLKPEAFRAAANEQPKAESSEARDAA